MAWVTQVGSIDELFKGFEQQVKDALYNVEEAVGGYMPGSSDKNRQSAKVRQPMLRTELDDDDDETEGPPSPAQSPTNYQKSRAVSETDEPPEKRLALAKTAPPQELHFVAPDDCKAGQPICLLGPHGDPITVPLPEGAEPRKPCSICLGPKSSFQVAVPEGAAPGAVLVFTTKDGQVLNTVVPDGKAPGDTIQIVPPVVLVQVPPGVFAGMEVVYHTPAGTPAVVQVPHGYQPGHYFPTLLPVPPNLAEIAIRAHEDTEGVQLRPASTVNQVIMQAKEELLQEQTEIIAKETPEARQEASQFPEEVEGDDGI